jgi:hypothetical protein
MKKYPGYIMAIFICFSITYMAMTFMNDEKADAAADDVMLLNEPSYEHKKGIIQFTHKKHSEEYIQSKDCGVCHHDNKGKPLIIEDKENAKVDRCIECHKLTGKPSKDKLLKIQWHQEAMHQQCKGCHKAYNKTKPDVKAPTTCSKCHPKTKK